MRQRTCLLITAILLTANLAFARLVPANGINLNAAVSHPYVLSGQNQKVYLRVGLEGFAIEDSCRPPVNISIVIDKSGSMSGDKIQNAKNAAISAINRLNKNDIISVITYDNTVTVVVPATKASDKSTIFNKINSINANGSTALHAGVCKGADELRKFKGKEYINRMILVSDGLANVGPQTPEQLGALGSRLIKENISVTTIGLGLGYNEDLMAKLAFKSDGGHYFVETSEGLAKVFDNEFGMATKMVAQEIQIKINCADGVRPVRLLGREGTIKGQDVSAYINQLHGKHEKYVILEAEVTPKEFNTKKQLAGVDILYHNMITNKQQKLHSNPYIYFTDSQAKAEKSVNAEIMVDVVEQIANERNELAVTLRDKGQKAEAKKLLDFNRSYLGSNAAKYDSEKLREDERDNYKDSQSLDGADWSKRRKSMRSRQTDSRTQNNY